VKAAIARAIEEKVLPLIADQRIRIVIDATYPLAEAPKAHECMDESHIGKVVLTL
jgi:NADPH2:quinone reductase